jgi:hypothetical protein
MLALNLLSESTNEPNLTWLLWLVLFLFVVIVIIGWMVSNKKDEPVGETRAAATADLPVSADDLKKIEGIGPKVESILNGVGIQTFADLAKADAAELRNVLSAAKLQMMEPSGWIEQAELAAKGAWDALEKLQDELKGGRHA